MHIAHSLLSDFQHRFDRLVSKAIALGVEPPTLDVSAPYYIPDPNHIGPGTQPHIHVVDVRVEGQPIKLDGWSFVARLDHTAEKPLIVAAEKDSTLFRDWADADAYCAHCQTNRRRKTTYLVSHEEHGMLQVGSTCVKDFTGIDPKTVYSGFNLFVEISDLLSDFEGGGHASEAYGLKATLTCAVAAIRSQGWVKSNDPGVPTKIVIHDILRGDPNAPKTEEKDYQTAKTIAAHYEQMEASSDFLYNLKIVLGQEYIEPRQFGFVAAAVGSYFRDAERRKAQADKSNDHIGQVKERLVLTLKVVSIDHRESDYGVTYLTKLEDPFGNSFTWFGSRELDLDQTYTGRWTVVKHDEWKGRKTTVINRPKLED